MACKYTYKGITYNSKEEFISQIINPQFLSNQKIRRVMEVQSDLFQKGRDKDMLISPNKDSNTIERLQSSENQFLQLLNKDNNWVTFFVKSIIQDSAKKGYEKVLFPVGDTANKIEGQETLSGFIKLKEDRLKSLASKWWTINKQGAGLASYENKEDAEKYSKTNADYRVISGDKLAANRNEIAILEREIENAKTNKTAFAAISTFYETAIFNILKKQGYNPTRITDEYGNGWYEVTITNKAFQSVFLQKEGITQSKASPKTIKKVKEWLHRLGVEIQTLQPEGGINGAASMLNNLIQLAEGKEDVAITEETMHFAVDIIELTNPELFKEMMNKIGKYNIYTSVKQLYSLDSKYQNTDGGPNIVKLKKEAIGKLLSEMYINSEQGQTEHPQLLQQAKTWWERILAFFGVLNKRAGFNPFQEAIESFEDLSKEGAPVKILAESILYSMPDDVFFKKAIQDTYDNKDYKAVVTTFYKQLTDESFGNAQYDAALKMLGGNEQLAREIIALGSPYYQLSAEQKLIQKEISDRFDKKLTDFQVEKITGKAEFDEQDDINFYQRIKDGKLGKVSKRVTDFVKESKRPDVLAKFDNATAIQKNTYKQKAAYGSQFHADAENIIDSALNSDGYLKPFAEIDTSAIPMNMPAPAFKALSQYLIGYMKDGEYIPGILQSQFPEGTLFKTETIVYDERKGRDVAGTIDLFGITPKGEIMIYDWKTKFLNTDVYSDIPFFSQQDYKIQLSQYKRILESYGLKDTDKGKAVIVAQAMPIIFKGKVDKKTGDVSLSSITFPEVDIKQETKRYLLPVAIDEQSSGNVKVDEYIKALEKLHQILYKQKDLNKVLKIEQLNAISGAIRELQVRQEFGPLAEQGLLFLKGAERLMLDINTQLKDKDGAYIDVDKEKLEEYRSRIKNVVDNIHKYQSTYQLFIDIYGKDNLTESQEETLQNLKDLALDSSVLAGKMEQEYSQFIAHYYTSKEGINILKTEKPIKGVINRSIQSLSRMQNVALQYLRTVTSRANFNKQKKAISKQEEFETLLKAFEQLASSKGLSKKDAFTLIAGTNKLGKPMNELLKKIKAEFYTKFQEAISSEQPDVDWIKENIDLEKWQEAKDIEEFNKQVDDSIYIIGDPEQDNIEKTRRKTEYKQRFDISKSTSLGWKREDLKFYIKDEKKWETEEYKSMSANKAALDLYNFIIALNREAKEIGYHDGNYKFSTRFLPWLRASTLDRIRNSGLSAIGDSIKSIYTLTPEEEISHARVDPNTGQIEKKIPAFFTKNFAEPIRDKDGNLEGYDLSDVSTDIGETISMYIEALYEYESLSDVEGAIQSVRDVEAGKKAYLLDGKGRIVVEKGTGKLEQDVDNKANVALYDSFVDSILYKRQYSGDSNLSTGATKIIEKANNYFRLKVFGLNVFTPMTTFIGGNLQGLINSRKLYRGKEFLKNELKIVGNLWGQKGNIEKGLMDYFIPFTENRARLKAERMSLDKIQRFSFSDLVMSPIRKTDVLVQMATSLSILENTIVLDGQLVNAREYLLNTPEFRDRYKNNTVKSLEKTFEEKVKSLLEQKGVLKLSKFNEKGLLEIEGIDRDSETTNKLRLKILNEIRTITGNLSEENKIDADRNILLKSMMMFKRWIPPLATNRFGGLQKNIDTNQYEMGRARMVWNVLFSGDGHWFKGIPQGIKTLRDMAAGNSEGIAALEKYYTRTAQTYKERTGNELEMDPEEFYDMTRRAITQQAKEIGVLLTMLSGFFAIRGAGVPDDDETKNFYRVSVRMLDKLTDEISFYYSPLSLQQITTGSWMPSLGLLTDGVKFTNSLRREANAIIFGNEEQRENAHPTKDFFSMIPVANQFFKTFVPLIDAETAKELGIQINTESRRQ